MELEGTVQNGAIVCQPGVQLPEGAKVQISVEEGTGEAAPQNGDAGRNSRESRPSEKKPGLKAKEAHDPVGGPVWALAQELAQAAQELGVDLSAFPTDLAENHDHYVHGLPKRTKNT